MELDCVLAGIALLMLFLFLHSCSCVRQICTCANGVGNCALQIKTVLWLPVNKCNYTCHSGWLSGPFFMKIKTVEVHSWGENKGPTEGLLDLQERKWQELRTGKWGLEIQKYKIIEKLDYIHNFVVILQVNTGCSNLIHNTQFYPVHFSLKYSQLWLKSLTK